MHDFKDKTVVITGAASGMGRSYAIAFAKLGANIAITDYNRQGLEQTEAMLKPYSPPKVYSEAFDISHKDAVFAFASNVQQALGNAHTVINNAGIGGGGQPVWAMDPKQYTKTLEVNFFGVVYGTQAFLPQLLQNDAGAIVNVSSIFGLVGTPNSSDYCASKFAVRGFTESLMVELQESNISVHLVHPGGVSTNIAEGIEGGHEFTEKYLKTSPDTIAQTVIKGIVNGRQRIICGHQSKSVSLLSWAVPLKWRNRLLHLEMKDLLNPDHYAILNNKNHNQ